MSRYDCDSCFYSSDMFCNKYKKKIVPSSSPFLEPRLPECHLVLHLHLKFKWFDQILVGEKTNELRPTTDYNKARIEGRWYDEVRLYRGYERTILRKKWLPPHKAIITHEEFGPYPVEVFVIDVSEDLQETP